MLEIVAGYEPREAQSFASLIPRLSATLRNASTIIR